jgi:hypothetical protein
MVEKIGRELAFFLSLAGIRQAAYLNAQAISA